MKKLGEVKKAITYHLCRKALFLVVALVGTLSSTFVVQASNNVQVINPGRVSVELREGLPAQTRTTQEPDLNATYPAPPKPSPTHVCKRADLDTRFIGGHGGEIYTTGACDATTEGRHAQWPLRAPFQITDYVRDQMANTCLREWRSRGRRGAVAQTFDFSTTIRGLIHIRYCFGDMQPTVDADGTRRWSIDCSRDGIHRDHSEDIPIIVSCNPGDVQGAPPPIANKPDMRPAPGRFQTTQLVRLSSTTPNTQIYYRTYRRSQAPTSTMRRYSNPIRVSGCGFMIEAYADREGYQKSPSRIGAYDVAGDAIVPNGKMTSLKGGGECPEVKAKSKTRKSKEPLRDKVKKIPRQPRPESSER